MLRLIDSRYYSAKSHGVISHLSPQLSFGIPDVTRRRPETCTWPVPRQYKATGLNPTAQSHTSSRELSTMGENNVSSSTNTDELWISRAHQTTPLCLPLSAGLSKGRRDICPGVKHNFVFLKLYGFPRLDRQSKLWTKCVVTVITQDMSGADGHSLMTHNYRFSVKKKKI